MEKAKGAPRRGAAFDRDWTQGSTVRNLLSLSWPMIVSNSLNMLGPTIDMVWVGRLGTASIAGVGVSGIAVMLMMAAMMGLFMGLRAMIARFIGAGNKEGANHVARQGFIISAAFGLVIASIGFFFAEQILILMGLEPDVVAEGAAYMRIMFIGALVMVFRMVCEAIMQASGDAVNPMRIAIFFRAFHVALCPFLVFGLWIFPRLGVSGAALTNVFSQSLGLALGLWVLFTGRSRLQLTLSKFRVDLNTIWRIVRIGLPASIMGMQQNLGQFVLMWLMVPFGTVAVAGHTLCQRVEMILFMPGVGLGIAAGVLAGQNLGARKPERAEKSGWLAAGMAEGLMLLCSLVILLWAEGIISIFNSEPGLVEIASTFLRIATVGYLVLGLVIVFMQCLSGVGDTLPPMLISLVIIWVVQLPLAYLLPRVTEIGVYGVRWGMVAGMLVGATAFVTYFRLGRWKRKQV